VKSLELPLEAFQDLKAYCDNRGIIFLSSPFDEDSVDLLADLGVAAFKVPSGEITNLPYLTRIAEYGRPMIVSTGMAYLSEVETAVQTIEKAGNHQYVLLHCVSNYPADPVNINLRAMHTLSRAFDMPSGYSDHTPGIEVPLAAVAMGACVVEKHFTTDRNLPGPDQLASLEPAELTAMVRGIRIVESALGNGRKEPAASEANTAAVARKSLVAAQDIPAHTKLTKELIAIKRPGTGLAPVERENLLGRTTLVDIPEDSLLTWEMLA
jgi:sialic acid synthase SpsE